MSQSLIERPRAAPGLRSDVPDLGDLTVQALLRLDESGLGLALRRLRREADHPEEVLCGWDSAV